jgi:hypothetical protein
MSGVRQIPHRLAMSGGRGAERDLPLRVPKSGLYLDAAVGDQFAENWSESQSLAVFLLRSRPETGTSAGLAARSAT